MTDKKGMNERHPSPAGTFFVPVVVMCEPFLVIHLKLRNRFFLGKDSENQMNAGERFFSAEGKRKFETALALRLRNKIFKGRKLEEQGETLWL